MTGAGIWFEFGENAAGAVIAVTAAGWTVGDGLLGALMDICSASSVLRVAWTFLLFFFVNSSSCN